MSNKEKVYDIIDLSVIKSRIVNSAWNGKTSEWSKRISVTPDTQNSICEVLYDTFGQKIEKDRWDILFNMAISGNGNELTKITTLHSSSLLVLLFFGAVSEQHPITIGDNSYTRVFFEVKNKVLPNASQRDPASNIDVMLTSEDGKKIMFIESKFTEYAEHGKVEISEKYIDFFERLFSQIPETGLTLKNNKIECTNGKNSKYIEGIKQMLLHIIGLATEPDASESNEIKNLIENAEIIEIHEILYNWDNDEFKNYSDLYHAVFDKFDSSILANCLAGVDCKKPKIDRIKVGKELLSYQETFNQNPQYKDGLSESIKKFYGF